MTEILVVRPDTLNKTDKALLRKAGVVVVESTEPETVRFLRGVDDLDSSDLAMAALSALRLADSMAGNSLFVKLIYEALQRRTTTGGQQGE